VQADVGEQVLGHGLVKQGALSGGSLDRIAAQRKPVGDGVRFIYLRSEYGPVEA